MPELIDPYARKIEYLRLSVTDRCDLRCTYCIPQGFHGFESPPHWLTFDEIERLVRLRPPGAEEDTAYRRQTADAPQRGGAGRPDSCHRRHRRSVPEHQRHPARQIRRGPASGRGEPPERESGFLRPECFARTAGRDALAEVLNGLEAARAAGFAPIKINMVVMSGVNEDEVDDMVGFCRERGFVLRLIEVMPMGETGRNAHYIDLQPIRQRLAERFGLVEGLVPGAGPARYLQSPDGRFSVGFITPISRHFCATCSRVSLAVDGTLYLCLGQNDNYAFRPLLRGGASDEQLAAAVVEAIGRKPERHDFREQPGKIVRFMNVTGG
jgi:cyclic pyranopterin phosphate synthase